MNIKDNAPKTASSVTTGPMAASSKIYSAPKDDETLRVPFREITLSGGEPALRVYDSAGPYTDPDFEIDVKKGLPRERQNWTKAQNSVEFYEGRDIRPEDNGGVTDSHAASEFPVNHQPLRAVGETPLTQFEMAKAGLISKEMIYVAHRENTGRMKPHEKAAQAPWKMAKALAPNCRNS